MAHMTIQIFTKKWQKLLESGKESVMLKILKKADRKEVGICVVFLVLTICLCLMPTGFEKQIYLNAQGIRAEVLSVEIGRAHV